MNTQSKTLKWSLIIGIVIVLNLFLNYAISLIYKSPDYISYCPNQQVTEAITTQAQCVSVGGQWNGNNYYKPGYPTEITPAGVPGGYCDPQFKCRQDYDAAAKVYDRNIFVALVVLGALSVLLGNFFRKNEVIASGLAMAGVLSFIIASMRYWSRADDLIHVIILAFALGILFWIAFKKFRTS